MAKYISMVSEACQINDLDHLTVNHSNNQSVSEACQINDLDHGHIGVANEHQVSEACQINDLDHKTGRHADSA